MWRWSWWVAVASGGAWLMTASAQAGDHGPHCHEPPTYGPAPTSVWESRADWRTVNWNCEGYGHGVHRKTQAFSLAMEAYFQSRRCWPAATYHRMDVMDVEYDRPMCGPRATRQPKSDDCD
jgi:hypothetical protein